MATVLGVLGTAVGNKVMKVADFVQFRCDRERNKLIISTTDFNAFMCMDYGDLGMAEMDVPDVFLIEFKKLMIIVKASTTADIEFVAGDKRVTVRTNGEYRLNMWADPSDFPQHDFTYNELARWPVPEIIAAWSKAVIAVSKDVTKLSYQGVCFDGNFAATDNRRVSVVVGETETDPMLLPPVFGEVIKHCKNEVSVGPNGSGKTLVVVCEEIGLIASVRLLDAQFQDYRPLIENYSEGTTVTVPKQDLVGAASRLSIFADQLFKVVKLSLLAVEGKLYLDVDIQNEGGGNEAIEVDETNIENLEVGKILEHKYHIDNLIDGVSAVGSPEGVILDFQDNGFLWIREGNFYYLLTPIIE